MKQNLDKDLEAELTSEARKKALDILKAPLGPNATPEELEERRQYLLRESELGIRHNLVLQNREKALKATA